jgi:Xaa-Pro aminopeptidase
MPEENVEKNGNPHGSAGEKKTIAIVVEGASHEWPKDEITYAEVVTLEVPDYPQHPEITYSVKYKKGHGNKPEGILAPGASVKVKEGMIFSVSETGKS